MLIQDRVSRSEDEEEAGTGNGQEDGGTSEDGDLGTSAAATEVTEVRNESAEAQPPARCLPAGPPSSHSRYPLNSRRLTAWHLRILAKALGLPTGGSPDQLRQCVEGMVQRDRDHHNVMVVVQESGKTEQIITLEDSEGEFLRCGPAYRDTPPQRTRVAEDTELVEGLRQQLAEAEQVIASAVAKDLENAETISELQEALASREELTAAHEEEAPELKQQLETDKERARKSWRTNCKHVAEQDAIITAHEKELTALRKQVRELQARTSRERVSATRDDRTSPPEPTSRESRPRSADRSPRDTRGEYSAPTHDPMRSDVDPMAIPFRRDPTVAPRPAVCISTRP